MPKVSVIIPIYGVEKYLREALDSVLSQTLTDLEIILIDDGSKDKCPDIIDEYAAKDNRIITIHKENGGYGQTMNVGLEKATGDYIAILEPDDYISSSMYEDLHSIAKKYNSDIVKSCFYDNLQCKQQIRIKKNEPKPFIPEDKSFTIKEYPYFLSYHPSVWSCLYKRDFLNKNNIHFIEAPGSGWTDNPFQVQTMCLAERINYTSNAYYYWRKLNENESDDLKDWHIPFARSDEIHAWLDENNICDENILVNLYKREIAYINIILGIKKIENINDCYKNIQVMCQRMNKDYVIKNFSKKQQKEYFLALKNPQKLRIKILLKSLRKSIISIRISHKEFYISLFGKTIIRSGNAQS